MLLTKMGIPDPANDLNRNGIEFLKTDSETGLTFAQIALDAGGDLEKKRRNQANARKAYDTVLAWLSRFALTESEIDELQQKLGRLKSALQALGEEFEKK